MTVLFLNDLADDPTKRLKLAGVRRYAAAFGWEVVPVGWERSKRENIPALLKEYSPIGCICDEDSKPTKATPRLFGDVPVVFANGYGSLYGGPAGRICVDNAAVARAAFRELSAGNPEAFAVVGESSSPEWSVVRIKSFQAEVAKTGRPCRIIRENRWKVPKEFTAYILPWLEALPRHTAIYAVNDPIARRIADAATAAKLRIPQDITLLGTDNTPALCEAPSPTISSIQLDFEQMGYTAAKILGEMISRRASEGAKPQKRRGMEQLGTNASAAPLRENVFLTTVGPLMAVRRESTGGRGSMEPHILEAVEIIRREACNGLTVAKLADRLPGSRRLLDLRFREAMGHSVLDEIQQVRLERVFDLLRQPGIRIGAIADFSGFALHQLDKVFRTRFGCSLRNWRKRNAQPTAARASSSSSGKLCL